MPQISRVENHWSGFISKVWNIVTTSRAILCLLQPRFRKKLKEKISKTNSLGTWKPLKASISLFRNTCLYLGNWYQLGTCTASFQILFHTHGPTLRQHHPLTHSEDLWEVGKTRELQELDSLKALQNTSQMREQSKHKWFSTASGEKVCLAWRKGTTVEEFCKVPLVV